MMLNKTWLAEVKAKDPATTWTTPDPSVGEQLLTTTMPLMQTCATTPNAELTVTPALVVGALRTLGSARTLTSKVLNDPGLTATTLTVRVEPTAPDRVGGEAGQVVVKVDGARQTSPSEVLGDTERIVLTGAAVDDLELVDVA